MFQRILVATDGSDGADRAVEYALHLAERYDATLYVIFVVDTDLYGEPALSSSELLVSDLEDFGNDVLEEAAEAADYQAIDVETECRHGRPYEEIVSYSEEIEADLVVMGYQGETHRGKIGTTASRVMRLADRPVLTV